MALIRPFARPPLTLGVARRQCLRPRGMTAYPHAFNLAVNLAERVLFVLFYERQTPVFVLHVLSHMPNTSSSSCCLSGTHSLKSFAPYFLFGRTRVWVRGGLSGMQIPCIRSRPLISSAEHRFGFAVDC